MRKNYKYTKKQSLLSAFGIKIECNIVELLVELFKAFISPVFFSWVLVPFVFSVLTSTLCFANVQLPLFFMIFGFVIVFFVMFLVGFILNIVILFILYIIQNIIHLIQAGLRQRYLPISLEDLENNNIQTIEQYWIYMENFLVVNDHVYEIFNNEAKEQCKVVFMTKFSESPSSFEERLKIIYQKEAQLSYVEEALLCLREGLKEAS